MRVSVSRCGDNLCLPQVRPSVLDTRVVGDPWIGTCTHPDLLVVYLNNHPVTLLPGSPLELASLNQILYSLRHRCKRQITTS
jgi:hypothetical protein